MENVINIQEAKTHLSRYIEDVAAGNELIIGKAGKPLARLVPFKAPAKPRTLGALSEMIWEEGDAWSAETDAELAAELGGERGKKRKSYYHDDSDRSEVSMVAEGDDS